MAISQEERSSLLKQYKTEGMSSAEALQKVNASQTSVPTAPTGAAKWGGTATSSRTAPYPKTSTTPTNPLTGGPSFSDTGSTAINTVKKTTEVPTDETWKNPVTGRTIHRPANMDDKTWKSYTDRLRGTGISDTQQSIINQQDIQYQQMAGAETQEEKDAIYAENLQGRKDRMLESLKTNPNVSPEYLELYERKWNPNTGKMEGVTDAEWAAVDPKYKRDLEAEEAVADQFGGTGDVANQTLMAYGSEKTAALIETGQVDPNEFTAQQLLQMGLTPERLQHLVDNGYMRPELLQSMLAAGQDLGIAQANLGATPAPTNDMMGVLQEALNAKNNFQDQKLGVSDLFTQAGVSGYEVLAQSLGMRAKEMDAKYQSAASVITATGGAMAETYGQIAAHYKNTKEDYEKQMDRLLKIDEQARKDEFAMDKMIAKFGIDKELAEFKEGLKRETMLLDKTINPATSYDGGIYETPGNIGVIDPRTGLPRPLTANETKVGGQVYNKNAVAKIFGVGGDASWCGTFASTLSTASKVGDSWAEKKTKITHNTNPTAGDKLLVPLGVDTDGSGYGHVATVLDYNPETGNVWVVESNRDGRMNRGADSAKVTFGVYHLPTMQTNYGSNFGFAQGDLKDKYKNALANAGAMDVASLDDSWREGAGDTPLDQIVRSFQGGGLAPTLGSIASGLTEFRENEAAPEQPGGVGSYADRYENITGEAFARDPKTGGPLYKDGKDFSALSDEGKEKYLAELATEKEEEGLPPKATQIDIDEWMPYAQGLKDKGYSDEDIKTELSAEFRPEDLDKLMSSLSEAKTGFQSPYDWSGGGYKYKE